MNQLKSSRWIALSYLQKAIRRGHDQLAQNAATRLYAMGGNLIRRRLAVIAVEDIGLADPSVIQCVLGLRPDSPAERTAELAFRLSQSVKDRSADHLLSTALYHPSLDEQRRRLSGRSSGELIALMGPSHDLLAKACVAVELHARAGGLTATEHDQLRRALIDRLVAAPMRPDLLRALGPWLLKLRWALPELLLLCAAEPAGVTRVLSHSLAEPRWINGIPSWAFDQYTQEGLRCLHRFSTSNAALAKFLDGLVPPQQWRKAVGVAVFYAEGARVDREFVWARSAELRRLAIEADLRHHGVPIEAAADLVALVGEQLDHLDAIREQLLGRPLQAPGPEGAP